MVRIFNAAICLLLAASVSRIEAQKKEVISVCDVLKNRSGFHGREVELKGYLRPSDLYENGLLMVGDCNAEANVGNQEWPGAIAVKFDSKFDFSRWGFEFITLAFNEQYTATVRGVFESEPVEVRSRIRDAAVRIPAKVTITSAANHGKSKLRIVSVCDLLSQSAKYHGRLVVVHGWVNPGSNGFFVVPRGCSYEFSNSGVSWPTAVWVTGVWDPERDRAPANSLQQRLFPPSDMQAPFVGNIFGMFVVKPDSVVSTGAPRQGFGEERMFAAQIFAFESDVRRSDWEERLQRKR